MVIEFTCPQCQRLLRTADEKAGRKASCPDCKTPITVPQPGELPAADFTTEQPAEFDDQDDQTLICPMCGASNDNWSERCRSCGEELTHVGVHTADGFIAMEYAPLGSRVVAIIIDNIITTLMYVPFIFIVGGIAANGGNNEALGALGNILSFLIPWLYFAIQESSEKQASVGKRVMGLTVATVDGDRLSFGHATGRYFALLLSQFLCIFSFGASLWMAGFTEKKQALHDMISKTVVYARPK